MWHVACSLPFSKRKIYKRNKKRALLQKRKFFFLPATLHSQIRVSTYQHINNSPLRIWCLSWWRSARFSLWYVACSLPFSKRKIYKRNKKRALLQKRKFFFLPATLHSQIRVSTYQHINNSPLRIWCLSWWRSARFSLWYVACSLPFSKRKIYKRNKKELFCKKESFFFCQPLSTLRSAFQPINISTTHHCGFGV